MLNKDVKLIIRLAKDWTERNEGYKAFFVKDQLGHYRCYMTFGLYQTWSTIFKFERKLTEEYVLKGFESLKADLQEIVKLNSWQDELSTLLT